MAYMSTRGADRGSADPAVAAEASARAAVVANPRDQAAQQRLCELLVRQSRLPEAEMALRKAISWLPEIPSLRIQLAFVLTTKGDHKGAREVLNQAATQMPPGSRIQQEVAKTAASFGPSPTRASEAPGAEAMRAEPVAPAPPRTESGAEPYKQAQGQGLLLTKAIVSPVAEPAYPMLDLDDVTPAGVADLMRAETPAAEPELATEMDAAAWGAEPEQRLFPYVSWRLAVMLAAIGSVAVLAAVTVTQRVDIVNRHMPALPWLSPPLHTPPPPKAPAPEQVPQTPPQSKTAAIIAAPAQPKTPPAKPAAKATPSPARLQLPDAALPMVTLVFTNTGPDAQTQADALATRLREAGVLVTGLRPAPPGKTPPGISYVFAEDRAAAEDLLRRLGDRYGPLVARATSGPATDLPGGITITLPQP
jgi:hypothetical protein